MLDTGGGRISLAQDNVIYIKKNGGDLTSDDQTTLWFSIENPNGTYHFEVKTKNGTTYIADLNWTQGLPTP